MMKKLMIAVAGLAGMVSTSALAQSYSYTYAAATGTGNSGSFTVSAGNGTYNLTAFNGTVAGIAYTLPQVGLGDAGGGRFYLGGLLNGVGGVFGGTNDFFERAQFTPGSSAFTDSFFYATTSNDAFVTTPTVTFTQVVASAAAVPEPTTWGMLMLGVGAIGFAMRRRVRASEVKFDAKIKRISEGAAA